MLTGEWRKSSMSWVNWDKECVEARLDGDQVLVREAERPGEVVRTSAANWRAFVEGVKAGEFDLLSGG